MIVGMPIFQFELAGGDFFKLSVCGFELTKTWVPEFKDCALFSRQDRWFIEDASCFLVYNGDDFRSCVENSNLFVIACAISCNRVVPLLKYRICNEDMSFNRRICDLPSVDKFSERIAKNYSFEDMRLVDICLSDLIVMNRSCVRLHNAIYFYFRAMVNTKWVDSFIFYVSALESLFSNDDKCGAAKTICSRVVSYVGKKIPVSFEEMKELYDIRSRLVHGKFMADAVSCECIDVDGNLKNLAKLESIVSLCLRRLVISKEYERYSTQESKLVFVQELG